MQVFITALRAYNREFMAYSTCYVQGFFDISFNLSITPIYPLIISFQWNPLR